ncbi:NAD(P)-binding protein [Guyanagaster necrorhizus]|uniref:NAD(P)-binding protein n=1 Tax=Guyanagaster necrorhizus TaxID=856835 RepID=A0A9P7VHY0_9AGAR|nr:NAD(P)-binding protein [Guyanagaster necrorhizus MCA 3950]KAG7441373.1 NAD(P)-binding protein [Guyanagaster necrorhizus MCA 3950]
MSLKIVIVGGHGNVSLRLARLLVAAKHTVISLIRNPDQEGDIEDTGATPQVLSLEDSSTLDFAKAFEGKDIVYWSAGAGGKGGEERTKKVDYEGAIKVFDAIEAVQGPKPRLIYVSAIDLRDRNSPPPAHYNEADIVLSERVHKVIPAYMHWKYEAEKVLVARTTFSWTSLRPGGLTNDTGTGKAALGKTHLSPTVSRDDVAKVLFLLATRQDANGIGIDIVGGENPVEDELDSAIKQLQTEAA